MQKLTTIDQLKSACEETSEFFVMLNSGIRSSKNISWDGETFYLIHEIDDSEEELTEAELMNTIIGEAISKGAFYSY